MKVFVAEYLCCCASARTDSTADPSLLSEGRAMLRALCEDVARAAHCHTLIDPHVEVQLPSDVVVYDRNPNQPLETQWIEIASRCDKTIIIAPETDGLLASLVAGLRASGIEVLAPSEAFLTCAADKRLFAKAMLDGGVSHPQPVSIIKPLQPGNSRGDWIVKPVDGCGSVGLQRIESAEPLKDLPASRIQNMITQPYRPGQPASVAGICHRGHCVWLPPATQVIDADSFEYGGGQCPLDPESASRATTLAQSCLSAMPGEANGFIGIDLVLGERSDEDCVIEINPRLTTSYIGLRQAIPDNPAQWMLGLRAPCEIKPQRTVRWNPNGEVWEL